MLLKLSLRGRFLLHGGCLLCKWRPMWDLQCFGEGLFIQGKKVSCFISHWELSCYGSILLLMEGCYMKWYHMLRRRSSCNQAIQYSCLDIFSIALRRLNFSRLGEPPTDGQILGPDSWGDHIESRLWPVNLGSGAGPSGKTKTGAMLLKNSLEVPVYFRYKCYRNTPTDVGMGIYRCGGSEVCCDGEVNVIKEGYNAPGSVVGSSFVITWERKDGEGV